MSRHFLSLYLLIVLTLAVASWGQDRLLQAYGKPEATDDRALAVAAAAVVQHLQRVPREDWGAYVAELAASAGVQVELYARRDFAGDAILDRLDRGEQARLESGDGEAWNLGRIDHDTVLAIRTGGPTGERSRIEWLLTFLFYTLIALVLMTWIWPLTRDLRSLERAAASYGDRNWRFEAAVGPRSQIYPLAKTFREMARRIDGLIASHKDMANAVSHEIKTPLSRMQFELALAERATDAADLRARLAAIRSDIAAIDGLVQATLGYAILERADVALNFSAHDFTTLVPALTEALARERGDCIEVGCEVAPAATDVVCDAHLFEAVLRNLLYNAMRHARREVRVTFAIESGRNVLMVDDDGPGIPAADRQRVFDSFVQLEPGASGKTGYGLGLAIVRRALEWHGGDVHAEDSPLGGARFRAAWPLRPERS
jgi:two-component system OmpR family sensor kinase